MLSSFTILRMDTKNDLIKQTIHKFIRIAHMHSRIEAMPIPINEEESISTREAHTIQAIGAGGNVNVTQLAEHFGTTKSAASQLTAKLERRGLLVKKTAAHSNKELVLSLTELGWTAFHAHEQFHGKDFLKLVECLSTSPITQIATLSVLMETLGEVMEKRLSQRSQK